VNTKQPPACDVLCEDVLRRAGAPSSLTRVRRRELRVREDGMLVEEIQGLHRLPICIDTTTVYRFFGATQQVCLAIKHR
jgi:hypothetical protein